MRKINRASIARIVSRYLSRTVLLFAIMHGFGQQLPDAKTAVTLSVICASNFVGEYTRDRPSAATSPRVRSHLY